MLLTRLLQGGERRTLENPAWSLSDPDAWRNHFDAGMTAETNESVSVDKALTLSPVWAAVKMISGDCSKLPLKVYRYRTDGSEGKDVDRQHQAWAWINRDGRANAEVSSLQLWRRFYAAALLWENGYIWIDRDDLGRIRGLYNLLPDRTAPYRASSGRLWYVTELAGKLEPLPADDVLHLCGLCYQGDRAPVLVEQARHDFGLAIAARKFESKFFANGAQHGGVLQVPPGVTKEARDKVEAAMQEKQSNLDRAFKTLVLRDGYKWFSTTVDPDKAQLIQLDEAKVRDVARWFMLSPSRLGVKESVSYNSEEAAKQDYYDTCLSYWLTATVAEANCKLLTEAERAAGTHVIRYQVNALLWADAATRASIAQGGIQTGRFSPDETRDWEGMNPRPDGLGGRFLRPVNMEAEGAEESDVRSAHERLLAAAIARCTGRLCERARRATRSGRNPEGVMELLLQERTVIEAQLSDVVAAVRSVAGKSPAGYGGGVALTESAVADRIYGGIRAVVQAGNPASGKDCTASQAAEAIARRLAQWQADSVLQLTAEFLP